MISQWTMHDVLAICPEKDRPQLKEVHKKLDNAVGQAKQIGDDNEFLIHGALSAVSYHLNRLNNAEVEQGYGQRGQEIVTRQQNLDFKA